MKIIQLISEINKLAETNKVHLLEGASDEVELNKTQAIERLTDGTDYTNASIRAMREVGSNDLTVYINC